MAVGRYVHAAVTGNITVAPSDAELLTVTVGTGAASAVLTVYDGIDAATGIVVGVFAATAAINHVVMVRCPRGIFAVLSGGNADVTIGYR